MSRPVPPLTPTLAARAEACEVAFWAEKVAALGRLAGNPYGAAVRAFGGATTMLARHTGNMTISQRNMEHVGLRLAYTKAIWTEIAQP